MTIKILFITTFRIHKKLCIERLIVLKSYIRKEKWYNSMKSNLVQ